MTAPSRESHRVPPWFPSSWPPFTEVQVQIPREEWIVQRQQ